MEGRNLEVKGPGLAPFLYRFSEVLPANSWPCCRLDKERTSIFGIYLSGHLRVPANDWPSWCLDKERTAIAGICLFGTRRIDLP